MSVFVLDNGAYSLKGGYSTSKEPRVMLNAIMKAKSERRRPFVACQIDECRDSSGLFYILPFQKGYLLNWDVQKTIWDHVFSKEVYDITSESSVIFTEPFQNFSSIQEATSEIFFEEHEVDSLLRINSSDLSVHKYHKENPKELCCLVVDSGYSFTHIIPYIQEKKQKSSSVRIDMGGKILTNYLKDIISYRQLNVMDETHIINQMKEDSCFVSQNFTKDMLITREKNETNGILRDYILPDFTSINKGFLRSREQSNGRAVTGEQIIRLNNERFSVPELLFSPSDIAVHEMGITEAIVHCINKCPLETRPHFYKNILLTGGNCHFEGFKERVMKDIRSMAPHEFDINVTLPKNPSTFAWHGGVALSRSPQFQDMLVTKKEWDEHGFSIYESKFTS